MTVHVRVGVGVWVCGVGDLVGVGLLVGVHPPESLVTVLESLPPVRKSVSAAWLGMVTQFLLTVTAKDRVPPAPGIR